MYLKYFGLTEKPFSLLPDPDYIFFSSRHQAAFAMLEYGLWEQSGITVITGAVGAGKTTLIRHLLRRIDYSNITVGMVNTSHSSFDDLLHWIVSAFGLTFEGKLRVRRHQQVYDALGERMHEQIHALSMKTLTPAEWAQSASQGTHHH